VEKEVRSEVVIELEDEDRIQRVCDKWDGKLPEDFCFCLLILAFNLSRLWR